MKVCPKDAAKRNGKEDAAYCGGVPETPGVAQVLVLSVEYGYEKHHLQRERLGTADRRALEHVIGQRLSDRQQLVIQVVNPDVPSTQAAAEPGAAIFIRLDWNLVCRPV